MKQEKIAEKIKVHQESRKCVKIYREISKGIRVTSHGYILAYSERLILLQETDDFRVLGFNVLPVDQIVKIRFNKWDKYYNKIMEAEGEADKVGIGYPVKLDSWKTVFESIKATGLYVIVECENPEIDSFTIGPIEKVGKKKVSIWDFDPEGYFDDEATSIDYLSISKAQMNDRYADVFSKYTRRRKGKESL